jgi:hypothetical protein
VKFYGISELCVQNRIRFMYALADPSSNEQR